MSEVIDAVEDGRPVPVPDHVSAPYFSACARGELWIQRCPDCGYRQHYPRPLCVECGAEPEWETTRGLGTVHTFTVVRQMGVEPFRSRLPYVVAMIELDEGPLMMGDVTDIDVDEVRIGQRVEVYMLRTGKDVAVPHWRPVRGDARGGGA
ncbi:hypothetical protein Acsp03_56220 [Actinomadura sp. NBRC 104412]|uniref:Zn-ribbon domain-containing OB-fold protein n=1 Tax=Actinomadura sp. NBRC 104412 TaxID=3032203 RepID=UPI0024A12D12|nr:Zn-ribbon domain-containing OB-fold protein [Actinomadura sp. NBRC 104412]GLZ08156.1 hypothetical protein Acsp03_56220 [Actinomadura sp. NBRC 104412]